VTRLTCFRDHAARMAEADHKPDCPHVTAVKPYWPRWGAIDENHEWCAKTGKPMVGLGWLGPEPPWERPPCDGCVTDDDRALWRRLAAEVDAYVDGDLFETNEETR
jgi:hypothetical protein